jgi:4a-hydroxytetrahydrobiopterin dehydratase
MDLFNKKCIPCEGGTPALSEEKTEEYLKEVPGWVLAPDGKKVSKEFKFKDFKETMGFVSRVAEVAESEQHHPDIHIFYNRVVLELWTHVAQGLTENDFILAAKVNRLIN